MTPPTWLYWPAAAAAWAPTDLASLYAWYKADAITGLNDGDPVSTWADSSGNGYDLTQTSTARPLYQTNELNGLPVIEFDGSNDYMGAATASDWTFLHDSTGSTVVAVWKAGTSSDPDDLLALMTTHGGTVNNHGMAIYFDDRASASANERITHIVARAVGPSANAPVVHFTGNGEHPPNAATILSLVSDPGNATAANRSSIRVDGGSATTLNTNTATPSTASPATALRLGYFNGSIGWLEGYIAEVVIFDAKLNDSDRQDVEGYLAHKWGLEGNLPAGHDHKTSPP